MPDYRIYRRESLTGFDGVTNDTAVYTQTRFAWTTPTNTVVGEWSPTDLGRQSVASLVSVASDIVGGGDLVQVVSDSGTVRDSKALNLAGTAWMLLYPQDSLRVTSATARVVQIFVNDLSDEQLAAWTATGGSGGGGGGGDCCDYSEQTFVVAGQIAAFAGRATVFAAFGVDGQLRLPALADIALGDSVTIVRTGGPGADVEIVTDNLGDDVNGVAGLNYWLRNIGESITYQRVSGGWARFEGEEAPPLQVVGAFPGAPLAWTSGTQYVSLAPAAPGGAYTLPPLNTVRIGARLMLVNDGTDRVVVQAAAGERIDGSTLTRNVRVGDSLMLEAAETAWQTGRGDESPDPISSALNVLLSPFRGIQHVELTGVGGLTVTLPVIANLPDLLNTVVVVYNNSVDRCDVRPQGADTIDNQIILNLEAQSRAVLISSAAGLWTSIVTQVSPPAITSAATPIPLGSVQGTKIVEMTGGAGQNVNLPGISSTLAPQGASVVVWNNSANGHTITPFGGQTIDGVAAPLAHLPGQKSQLISDGVGNWIHILSA